MANHDLVLGQSQNMSSMPVSQLAFDHTHDHDSAHNLDSEPFLSYAQDNQNEHGMDSQLQQLEHEHAQNLEQNGNKLDADDHVQDHAYSENNDNRLALANEGFESNLSDDRQLVIIQDDHDNGPDDNLEFSLDQNVEMNNSVQWVAESMEQHLRENPNCKPKEILEEIQRVHGITLSYKQAWRGKERIMAAVRGSFEEDFRLLPQYCDQLKRSNPGSIALVYGNPVDNCFQRLFISFQALIYGFLNACRPIIGLDCVPHKSKHLGTSLLAAGFDGDGGLYPLAFGVVNEEIDENWMWFLSELHNLLETNAEHMSRLTILSNRKKGIVEGVDMNFPTAFHGFCLHYLSESFMKEFNNSFLTNILWEAADSLTAVDFETKILEIEEISPDATEWIRSLPSNLWATAYFEGTRLGQLTANMAESLNTMIVEASGLPIIEMMESIRRQSMMVFNERRETSMEWTSILVPYAERQVCEAIEQAHSYKILKGSDAEFEVLCQGSIRHIVDISTRCCSCHGWQLCGLPCSHAVAVLLLCRQNVHRFTESCFTVANYCKAYSQTIHPIPDKAMWKTMLEGSENEGGEAIEVVINPPKSLRSPGKPRKRRPPADDSGEKELCVAADATKQGTSEQHAVFLCKKVQSN